MIRMTLAVGLLLLSGLSGAAEAPAAPARLDPSSAIEREIAGGETHAYLLPVAAAQIVRMRVRPFAVDVALSLRRDEQTVVEVPGEGLSVRVVSLVSDEPAVHRLEVRSLSAPGRRGRYRLSIATWRDRGEGDEERIALDRAFGQAQRLRREGSPSSLRQAVELYRMALAGWRTLGDGLDQANALSGLGEAVYFLGDPDGGRRLFEEELLLRRAGGDRAGEGDVLQNLGVMNALIGFRRRAAEYYEELLALRRAEGDKRGEASALRNMGVNYRLLGDYQTAAECLRAALPLWREVGDQSGEAYTLHSLGGFYFAVGDLDTALTYVEQTLALRRQLGERPEEGRTLHTLGVIHARNGDVVKARAYYEEAQALRRATGDTFGEAWTLQGLGETWAASDAARALQYYEQALALSRTSKNRPIEASTLHLMGEVLARLGDLDAAQRRLEEALEVEREVGDRAGEAATRHALGRLERDRGDLARATEHMEGALAILDTLRVKVARQDLRQTFVGEHQERYDDYLDLLMERHRRRPEPTAAAAAFAAAEHSRARTLRDILLEAGADIRRGLDPAVAARLRQAQEQLNAREQERLQVFAAPSHESQREKARRAVEEALGRYQEAESQVRAAHPRLAALRQPQARTAPELQSLLDAETVVLEYALGAKRSHLFVVSRDEILPFELPPRQTVEAAARRYRDQLLASHHRAARPAARLGSRELARMLVAPAAPWIRGRRLVIVPDGALHLLPFGALLGPETGRPLVVDHEIVQVPALGVVAQLREETPSRAGGEGAIEISRPRSLMVMADPVMEAGDPRVRAPGGSGTNGTRPVSRSVADRARSAELRRSLDDVGLTGFERLAFSRREAEGIRRIAGADATVVALDFEASRETVLSDSLREARVVHFATHALMNGEHPELSGLVLSLVDEAGRARDGFVRLHDVYNLELAADLVVLSACRTAVGREVRGEGVVSLTRGFMYAGAPRVMASLWDVRDEASAELMKRFYEGLVKRRLRPAAALRAAQVSLAKEPRWSAPFYWAGFVFQGEWR
jgi:CHAT domain-containing protein/Flp pilus assembly protein TadD